MAAVFTNKSCYCTPIIPKQASVGSVLIYHGRPQIYYGMRSSGYAGSLTFYTQNHDLHVSHQKLSSSQNPNVHPFHYLYILPPTASSTFLRHVRPSIFNVPFNNYLHYLSSLNLTATFTRQGFHNYHIPLTSLEYTSSYHRLAIFTKFITTKSNRHIPDSLFLSSRFPATIRAGSHYLSRMTKTSSHWA